MNNNVRDLLDRIDDTFAEHQVHDKRRFEGKAGVFLFFSVDMVNATHFKTANQTGWVSVFNDFYDMVGAQVKKAYINAEVWKYAGDEILFYIKAGSLEDILIAPPLLYAAVTNAQKMFHKKYEFAAHSLFFKSALWVAAVSGGELLNSKHSTQNIYTELSVGLDFVGVDIDEGFRMSKNALKGKLVLDPKIAYLINKHSSDENVKNFTKIVGFDFLKGVWGGRAFPVIWYCDKWDSPDLFMYDEQYNNAFAKDYCKSGGEAIKSIDYIVKIFNDLGFLDQRTAQIEEIINYRRIPAAKQTENEPSELLKTTICYDTANNRAFIVKSTCGNDARKFIYVQKEG
jgi:hypothetical protein